jgi:hypothetical protein
MGPRIFSSWLDITSGALSVPSAASDDAISARSSGFGIPEHKHSVNNRIMGYGTLPWTRRKPDRQKIAKVNFIFHERRWYSYRTDWNGSVSAGGLLRFYISSNV